MWLDRFFGQARPQISLINVCFEDPAGFVALKIGNNRGNNSPNNGVVPGKSHNFDKRLEVWRSLRSGFAEFASLSPRRAVDRIIP